MFSPHLFDHKYDIDDLIHAFCGDQYDGRWLLDSRRGVVIAETERSNTQDKKDGDDDGHWHEITPLPKVFAEELLSHEKRNQLSAEDLQDLDHFLKRCEYISDFESYFENGRTGGWLRERVKEAVLDWLEMKNMIPPSMRHVRDSSLFGTPPTPSALKDAAKKKVTIT